MDVTHGPGTAEFRHQRAVKDVPWLLRAMDHVDVVAPDIANETGEAADSMHAAAGSVSDDPSVGCRRRRQRACGCERRASPIKRWSEVGWSNVDIWNGTHLFGRWAQLAIARLSGCATNLEAISGKVPHQRDVNL